MQEVTKPIFSPEVTAAISLAHLVHQGQKCDNGKTSLVCHLAAVAEKVADKGDACKVAAWLHEYLEKGYDRRELYKQKAISNEVIEALDILYSPTKSHSHQEYLLAIRKNPIARAVKIACMLDTLGDRPTDLQIIRYAQSLLYLV